MSTTQLEQQLGAWWAPHYGWLVIPSVVLPLPFAASITWCDSQLHAATLLTEGKKPSAPEAPSEAYSPSHWSSPERALTPGSDQYSCCPAFGFIAMKLSV